MNQQVGSVEVEVRANLVPLQQGFAKAEAEAKSFGTRAEQALKSGFGAGGQVASRSLQAVNADITNLRFQINDVATGLLSGSSPFMVLSQQAGQFSQILSGAGGVRGALGLVGTAFASMLNPINLAIAGIGVATYAASSFFEDTEDDAAKATAALKEHADIIARIRDMYGEAAAAAIKYGQDSQQALGFDAALNEIKQSRSLLDESKAFLEEVGTMTRGGFRVDDDFNMFADAVRNFRDSVVEGRPDVETLIAQIRETASSSPGAAEGILGIADALITAAQRAREAANALSTVTTVYATGGPSMGPDWRGPTLVPPDVKPPSGGAPGYRGALQADVDKISRGRGGGSRRDPFGEGMERAAERLRLLEQEKTAIGMTGEALARYRAEMQFLNSVHDDWNKLTEKQQGALEAEAHKIGDYAASLEQAKEAQRELKEEQQKAEDAMAAVGDAAENLFMGLMEGGDAAKQAIAQLVAELLRAAILGDGPLSFFFGGGVLGGGGGGAGASAGASVPSGVRAPSGRVGSVSARSAGGGGGSSSPTIIVQGNMDRNAAADVRAELRRFQREQDERQRNSWRVN